MLTRLPLYGLGLLLLFTTPAFAKTVCTMTFNSSDEKEVLRAQYEKQGVRFVELVPEDRDDQWLQKACRSGVQCDVLLVSGHFGGVFFGEASGLSLSLPEMETASCDSACDGIFQRPQDVMLYGCNTLATKKKDHRTFEEYVSVLVRDGFDRDLAESVALTRYADLGISMSERFSAVFSKTARIHGYSSTGPLGAAVAPHLRRAFQNTTAEQFFTLGSPVDKLQKALGASSYAVVRGDEVQNKSTYQRQLLCHADDLTTSSFADLFSEDLFLKHYDLILQKTTSSVFMQNLKFWSMASGQNENLIRSALNNLQQRSELTLSQRLRLVDFHYHMDWLSEAGRTMMKRSFLQQKVNLMSQDGFTYQEAEQICSMKPLLNGATFETSRFSQAALSSPYLATMQSCLQSAKSFQPALLPEGLDMCLLQANKKTTVDARDGSRWSCFNSFETQLRSLSECQTVASHFETESRRGLDWVCIRQFSQELTADRCVQASAAEKEASAADNMLWGCWSRLKTNANFKRPDCLALSVNMNIHGNRLKMNWNCQNRLRQ